MKMVQPVNPTTQRRQIISMDIPSAPIPEIDAASSDESGDSSDDEGSSSEDSSSDDESRHDRMQAPSATNDPLINVGYTNQSSSGNASGTLLEMTSTVDAAKKVDNGGVPGVTQGLEGLVMAPLVVGKDSDVSNNNIEDDSSNWTILVRHDLAGGLAAQIRFLRGASRDREAKLLGFDPKNTAVVCVQIKFENKRSDRKAIRRIHLAQRKVTTSGTVPTTRVKIPQEISSLDSSKISLAVIGLESAQASSKDGSILAKFDVKCDRGTTQIEIRPPLAETIQPIYMAKSEFVSLADKMHDIHQRSEALLSLRSDKRRTCHNHRDNSEPCYLF